MAITGRSLGEAARHFTDHLNRLLASTITDTRLVPLVNAASQTAYISFRQLGPVEASLETKYGPLRLSLGQICACSINSRGDHELYTLEYAYHIYGVEEKAILRWEYKRKWPKESDRWCRHHLPGPVELPLGNPSTLLNNLHLPTGYVCIEDIIRFCICDLGVTSKSENWHDLLEESYKAFRTDFTQLESGQVDP